MTDAGGFREGRSRDWRRGAAGRGTALEGIDGAEQRLALLDVVDSRVQVAEALVGREPHVSLRRGVGGALHIRQRIPVADLFQGFEIGDGERLVVEEQAVAGQKAAIEAGAMPRIKQSGVAGTKARQEARQRGNDGVGRDRGQRLGQQRDGAHIVQALQGAQALAIAGEAEDGVGRGQDAAGERERERGDQQQRVELQAAGNDGRRDPEEHDVDGPTRAARFVRQMHQQTFDRIRIQRTPAPIRIFRSIVGCLYLHHRILNRLRRAKSFKIPKENGFPRADVPACGHRRGK